MTIVSYHVSHEQFAPSELLGLVRAAEEAGFRAAFSSDHLQPWAEVQGQSGFTWSWLGAALARTREMSFAAITVPCGWRYHPVVLAQAVATLGEMFTGRVPWIALGSGQAINETALGHAWPDKSERNARLAEGAAIMRGLLAGETVTCSGRLDAAGAKIWSRPSGPATRLMGAATSAATAEQVGRWADGLLTLNAPKERMLKVIDAFRRGGGEGKPVHIKLDLSWARTEAEALQNAYEQWRFAVAGGDAGWDLRRLEDFDQATRFVRPDDMRESVLISHELNWFVDQIRQIEEIGVASIDLHNVGRNQEEFIEAFGERVLPALQNESSG